MMQLPRSLAAWDSPEFDATLKAEIEQLDASLLPLQAGLSRSSYATNSPHAAVVLGATNEAGAIRVRVGIFYSGIIAGCSCADDPTPVEEENEYCEVQVVIDKATGAATVTLLSDRNE